MKKTFRLFTLLSLALLLSFSLVAHTMVSATAVEDEWEEEDFEIFETEETFLEEESTEEALVVEDSTEYIEETEAVETSSTEATVIFEYEPTIGEGLVIQENAGASLIPGSKTPINMTLLILLVVGAVVILGGIAVVIVLVSKKSKDNPAFCGNCGHPMPPEQEYCLKCGKKRTK